MCQFFTSVAIDGCVDFISGKDIGLNSQTEHKHQVNRGRIIFLKRKEDSVRQGTAGIPACSPSCICGKY